MEKITATFISELSRDEKRIVLQSMVKHAPHRLGSPPELTAHKILDKEMSVDALWLAYQEMADYLENNG